MNTIYTKPLYSQKSSRNRLKYSDKRIASIHRNFSPSLALIHSLHLQKCAFLYLFCILCFRVISLFWSFLASLPPYSFIRGLTTLSLKYFNKLSQGSLNTRLRRESDFWMRCQEPKGNRSTALCCGSTDMSEVGQVDD